MPPSKTFPVGPYPDFEACIADNQDKDDPGAFCAFLEKETEAAHLDKEDKTMDQLAIASGLELRNGRWTHAAKDKTETKTVADVQIFSTGVFNGDAYTEEDLDGMVKAFNELRGLVDPPVKIGHTSDEFNQALAAELNVPKAMLTGDEFGQGAMALGWLDNMHREGKKLITDFVDVPTPVADQIESGAYQKVSAEILWMFDVNGDVYKYVITGVALLGAELPAVLGISGVADSAVFTYTRKPNRIVEFTQIEDIEMKMEVVAEALEDVIKGKRGAVTLRTLWNEVRNKAKAIVDRGKAPGPVDNNEEVKMKELLKLLGLDEEATEETAMKAVKALQEKPEADVERAEMAKLLGLDEGSDKEAVVAAITAMKGEGTSETKEFANLKQQNMTLQTDVKKLQRESRIAHYTALASKWPLISGKPEEIAEKLVKLEEINKEASEDQVMTFQQTQDALATAGIAKPIGSPAEGDVQKESEFEKEVRKYSQENHVDEQTAFAKVRGDRDDLFREFMRDRPRVYAKSPERES